MKFLVGLGILFIYSVRMTGGKKSWGDRWCSLTGQGCIREIGPSPSIIPTDVADFLKFTEDEKTEAIRIEKAGEVERIEAALSPRAREVLGTCPHHEPDHSVPAVCLSTKKKLDEIMKEIRDRDRVTTTVSFPNLDDQTGEDIPPELSESLKGRYELESLAMTTEARLLIPSENSKGLIFKYHKNCFAMETVQHCESQKKKKGVCQYARDIVATNPEALLREYAFTKIVFELGLAPEPYVLSPPVRISEKQFGGMKTTYASKIRPEDLEVCVAVHTTVRLLVEQLVGSTISGIFAANLIQDNPISLNIDQLRLAAKIFHQSLIMLEKLHAIGIVHGDFHYGNLAFRHTLPPGDIITKEDKLDLVFIDFGSAIYYPDPPVFVSTDVSRFWYYSLNQTALSPFHLEGRRVARRDDIYRAFESFIDVLGHHSLVSVFVAADDGKDGLKMLKKYMDFCGENSDKDWTKLGFQPKVIAAITQYPGLASVEALLGVDLFAKVQTVLREIQLIVRDDSSSIEPKYSCLIAKAQAIVELVYTLEHHDTL